MARRAILTLDALTFGDLVCGRQALGDPGQACAFVACWWEPRREAFCVLLEHPEFLETPEGASYPEVTPEVFGLQAFGHRHLEEA